jgi:hypothetical protein
MTVISVWERKKEKKKWVEESFEGYGNDDICYRQESSSGK